MNYLNKKSAIIFGRLVASMNGGDHVRIDNTNGTYMPVVAEKLYAYPPGDPMHGYTLYSLTHYGTQNGDPMRDPDMTFMAKECNGEWYVLPASYRNDYLGMNEDGIYFDADAGKYKWNPDLQRSHTSFANNWLVNINLQQGILRKQKGAV